MIEEYIKWLDHAPLTVKAYTTYVTLLLRSCDPLTVTRDEVQAMRDNSAHVNAAATVNLQLAAWRSFFKFLQEKGYRADDPMLGIKRKKLKKRLPKTIQKDDVARLFEEIKLEATQSKWGKQDLAIASVLFGSGLRRHEAATMTLDNIRNRYLIKIIGKGGKERATPIVKQELDALVDWVLTLHGDAESKKIEERIDREAAFIDLCKRKPEAGVFKTPNQWVKDLKHPGDWLYQRIVWWGDRISVRITPHMFRHSWVTELLGNGAPLHKVQMAAGHADPRTTQGYWEVVEDNLVDLRDNHSFNK